MYTLKEQLENQKIFMTDLLIKQNLSTVFILDFLIEIENLVSIAKDLGADKALDTLKEKLAK